jgi:hypothetical protein
MTKPKPEPKKEEKKEEKKEDKKEETEQKMEDDTNGKEKNGNPMEEEVMDID